MQRNIRDNEEMAKLKIRTLELELEQQSEFFRKQELNYEQQIEMLHQEASELRNGEQKFG
jgi:hypothetical protein